MEINDKNKNLINLNQIRKKINSNFEEFIESLNCINK